LLLACSSEPPNVILYVADTLRADSVGPYGNDIVDTPSLDALAAEGIVFENAYAHSSWTRPSIASMLTGLEPGRHGVETRTAGLTDVAQLLSERFQEAGYSTGAVLTNPNVASFFGFDQGYDEFIEMYDRRDVDFVDAEELVADSAMATEQAIRWIEAAGRPFFLFILVTDPHWPYLPPDDFDRYGGDYRGGASGSDFALRESDLSPEDRERIHSLYLGEIAFLDHSLGRLLDHLRRRGLYQRTVVAFTSDHGEEFWEHRMRGHGRNLFEESVRVPLIIRDPRSASAGTRRSGTARSVDIFPTLLEMAGLPLPQGLDGVSLLAAAGAGEVYFSLDLDGTRLRAVTSHPWKLTWDEESGRQTLINLSRDPGEHIDVSKDHPHEARRLSELLAARALAHAREPQRLARTMFGDGEPDRMAPEDVLRALEALGYREGPAAGRLAEGEGLSGAYYPNATWAGDPVHRRVDAAIDFDWLERPGPMSPPFSIEWTGALEIDEPGRYEFTLESDDGSILEVDGTVVVDNGGEHPVRTRTGSIQLAKGMHPVRIRYFNEVLGGKMRMLWKPPGATAETVPARVLTPTEGDR
jgi:arylsulfatase A-like enzyme